MPPIIGHVAAAYHVVAPPVAPRAHRDVELRPAATRIHRRDASDTGARWHIRNRTKRKNNAIATDSGFTLEEDDEHLPIANAVDGSTNKATHPRRGRDTLSYSAFKDEGLDPRGAGSLHVDAFASDLSLHSFDAPSHEDLAFPLEGDSLTTELSSQNRGHTLDPLTLLRRLPLVRTPAAADDSSPAAAAAPAAAPVVAPPPHEPSPPPEFARSGAAVPLPWWRLTVVDRQMLGQVATCAAAAIAEPLLGMVDTICIGHLGLLPLAAMAPNNTIFGMINQLATFTLVVTVANKVAIALGAGSKVAQLRMMSAEAALNVGNAFALGLGVAVAAAFVLCPDPVLNLFGAYPATLGVAREYFQVRALGAPAALLTMSLQGAYSAALDLRTPLLAIVGSGLLNGSLDLLLIFGLNWGMAGAAAATVVAQYAACALLVYRAYAVDRKMFALPPLPEGGRWWREGVQLRQPVAAYKDFLRMCMVQMMRAVNVILAWTMCNVAASRLGMVQAASHQLVFQFQMFQVLAMQSFATVGNSVTARAFQGGGMRAARRVADRLLVFGVVASTTLAASTWLAREHLPRLFTSDMACNLACQPAFLPVCLMISLTWFKVPEGALLGVGDGRYLAMCYVPAAAVTMLQLLHSHVRGLGLRGVWFALALYYFTLMVLFCARWYGGNYVQQRAGKNNAAPAPADSWTDTEPLDDDHLPAAAA